MDRITERQLEGLVESINRVTKNALTPYTKNKKGVYVANIGNYHISGAYGGVCLHQMANKNGGIHDVFSCGHVAKRDLYNRMRAFLVGLEKN